MELKYHTKIYLITFIHPHIDNIDSYKYYEERYVYNIQENWKGEISYGISPVNFALKENENSSWKSLNTITYDDINKKAFLNKKDCLEKLSTEMSNTDKNNRNKHVKHLRRQKLTIIEQETKMDFCLDMLSKLGYKHTNKFHYEDLRFIGDPEDEPKPLVYKDALTLETDWDLLIPLLNKLDRKDLLRKTTYETFDKIREIYG
jgi:hypothetical protein